MPEPFPDFEEPIALVDGGSWTAVCESFNQREDAAYYFVTRVGPDGSRAEFWAEVYCPGPPTRDDLLPQVQKVAGQGVTNTKYTGSIMWKRRRSREAQH